MLLFPQSNIGIEMICTCGYIGVIEVLAILFAVNIFKTNPCRGFKMVGYVVPTLAVCGCADVQNGYANFNAWYGCVCVTAIYRATDVVKRRWVYLIVCGWDTVASCK